jgi:hypothetical protein
MVNDKKNKKLPKYKYKTGKYSIDSIQKTGSSSHNWESAAV